jgi:hypothetical protein
MGAANGEPSDELAWAALAQAAVVEEAALVEEQQTGLGVHDEPEGGFFEESTAGWCSRTASNSGFMRWPRESLRTGRVSSGPSSRNSASSAMRQVLPRPSQLMISARWKAARGIAGFSLGR